MWVIRSGSSLWYWSRGWEEKGINNNNNNNNNILPSPLERNIALVSVMLGKCGLIRSSMVTVARELKADEMVL